MLPSPSTPRTALEDRTNERLDGERQSPARPSCLPTPPYDGVPKGKRKACENEGVKKRARTAQKKDIFYDTETSDDDCEMDDAEWRCAPTPMQRCASNVQGMLRNLATGNTRTRRHFTLPTYPILRSFVSSNDLDVFRCRSMDDVSYSTPPYACSFSNESRRGAASILAVATEQGTIEIINTAKRSDDDAEPTRTTLQIHNNGIFDIKWSPTDRHLVTASGDRTARIIDPCAKVPEALHILQGHTSTVKCAVWNPMHTDLLATGGRDGSICLWDLRVGGTGAEAGEEDPEQSQKGPSRLRPVITVPWTHETVAGKPTKIKRGVNAAAKSVTALVYTSEYDVVSSGSLDGILRKWDLRYPSPAPAKKPRVSSKRTFAVLPTDEASADRTIMALTSLPRSIPSSSLSHLSSPIANLRIQSATANTFSPKRARGISSLALGGGPSVGKLFALGYDSRVHVYNASGAAGVPLSNEYECEDSSGVHETYSHPNMAVNSFYVRLGVSPCGRWLASGSSGGSAYLFDITQSQSQPRPSSQSQTNQGIRLSSSRCEIGALDWAYEALATCADDGTVRVWRPDMDTVSRCWEGEVFGGGMGGFGVCVGMGRMRGTSVMKRKWCWADMPIVEEESMDS